MPAGSGIGPMREQMMIVAIEDWISKHGKMRVSEMGGIDLYASLVKLNPSIKDGSEKEKQIIQAHRYLRMYVEELNKMLNGKD